ncbi:MAG: hypothetical protein EU548_09055 [Promethearchaeota archaeon]|nr:MAG: hypothetical protein EU548_09055 [Candidatus Lokiarchaeota archaeon]
MRIINFNVNKVQREMNSIVNNSDIFGSILCSQEGLIIVDTFGYDSLYNTETISAMSASMIHEHNYGFIPPEEIILIYNNEKIIIRNIFLEEKDQEFLLISIIPINMRYFRRKINTLEKIIKNNL